MFFVLFLNPDLTVYMVKKFFSLTMVRKYIRPFQSLGSVKLIVASFDLQTIYLKTF